MTYPGDTPSFLGLQVAAFESRRAGEMAALIRKFGGQPRVSASMREVPLEKNPQAVDFAQRLLTGHIDMVIFLTGVGARNLLTQVERHVDRERFLSALGDITTVVRGPKPLAVLREWGISPTIRVPEPNTWREVLTTLDEEVTLANLAVAVQEYGLPNPSLVAGLEARGARVETIKVYSWDLPVDTRPLAENIRALCDDSIDVALFTSAHQAVNVLALARQLNLAERLLDSLQRVVVGAIGPTTAEALRELEFPVDFEPEHSKMGQFVATAAQCAGEILRRKRQVIVSLADLPRLELDRDGQCHGSPFMMACRRQPTDFTPIWLMRQAGRYLPEYRAIRERVGFMELCKNPDLSAEVMVRAVERLGVDAAILFADLLPMLEPMGLDLEFSRGEGPLIHNPVREPGDVDRVLELEEIESLAYVIETVRQTRARLPRDIPLIGFAGAPFTLASYVIEGGASRTFLHTKTLMYRDEGAWDALLSRLARAVAQYLRAQIQAGVQAVQIFDSWIGCLSPDDYRRFALRYSKAVIAAMPEGVPVIHFGTGNPCLLPLLSEAGGDVIGVDWRIRLDDARRAIGDHRAIQGNLDPAVLLADPREIRRQAKATLDMVGGRPGHIFNLGHGILPQTPPDHVRILVDAVHELSHR